MISGRLRIFVSYAREDEKRADALYASLEAAGFQPWMDRRNIPEAADWQASINRAIERCDVFLACLSNTSVAKSGVLAAEIQTAVERWRRRRWWSKLMLLPVRFEDCQPPASLSHLQWVDVFRDADWVRVASALRRRYLQSVALSFASLGAVVLVAGLVSYSAYTSRVLDAFRAPGGQPRVGVTVWKLKQVPPSPGSKELLHEPASDANEARDWQPYRAGDVAPFHSGDHVRFTVESGNPGYLYIVDQEKRVQALGNPKLVFPTKRLRDGNNLVEPGTLVEIPDQADTPPYWTLKRNTGDYQGERITVIIVPEKLPIDLKLDAQPISPERFEAWLSEFGSKVAAVDVRRDPAATAVELAAGRGTKSLRLDDPLPQKVFQRWGRSDGSIAVNFLIETQ